MAYSKHKLNAKTYDFAARGTAEFDSAHAQPVDAVPVYCISRTESDSRNGAEEVTSLSSCLCQHQTTPCANQKPAYLTTPPLSLGAETWPLFAMLCGGGARRVLPSSLSRRQQLRQCPIRPSVFAVRSV